MSIEMISRVRKNRVEQKTDAVAEVILLRPVDAARVQEALDNSISDASKRAYASDWRAFVEWCRGNGYRPMPAPAEVVIAYLTSMAASIRPDGKPALLGQASR